VTKRCPLHRLTIRSQCASPGLYTPLSQYSDPVAHFRHGRYETACDRRRRDGCCSGWLCTGGDGNHRRRVVSGHEVAYAAAADGRLREAAGTLITRSQPITMTVVRDYNAPS
jgi:hypothetical protein